MVAPGNGTPAGSRSRTRRIRTSGSTRPRIGAGRPHQDRRQHCEPDDRPPDPASPTSDAITGPPASPPHIDSPNQPASRPRCATRVPASTHGNAAENSAASPAPITSRATSSTARFGATSCPKPPTAASTPPTSTTGRDQPASASHPANGRRTAVARNAIPTAVPLASAPPPNFSGTYDGNACNAAPNARYPHSTATHNRRTGTPIRRDNTDRSYLCRTGRS